MEQTGTISGPEIKLDVCYCGSDPDRGRMSALEIGPAIFGIGQMVGQASRILYGDDTRVRVEVQADFKHASFGIELFAVATPGDLLSSLTVEQLAAIAAILGFSVGAAKGAAKGLLGLLRWQRGRRIERVERIGDEIHMTVQDQSVNVTVNEYKVFIDPDVRRGLKSVIAPLERDGVDQLSIKAGVESPTIIEKGERESLASAPLPEEEVSLDTATAILEVISPVFREGNKWRFAQGGPPFWAGIEDEAFLERVARHGISFGRGDALKVRMEIRTTRSGGELAFERRIVEVVDHIQGPGDGGNQIPLL